MGCGNSSVIQPQEISKPLIPKFNNAIEYCPKMIFSTNQSFREQKEKKGKKIKKHQISESWKLEKEKELKEDKAEEIERKEEKEEKKQKTEEKNINKEEEYEEDDELMESDISIIRKVISNQEEDNWITVTQMFKERPTLTLDVVLDSSNWTVLHYAARYNNYIVIDLLLKRQYKIDGDVGIKRVLSALTNKGYTPLMIAATYDSLPCMKIFLECGGFSRKQKNFRKSSIKKVAKYVNAKHVLEEWIKFSKKNSKDFIDVNQKYFENCEFLDLLESFLDNCRKLTTDTVCLNQSEELDKLITKQQEKFNNYKSKLTDEQIYYQIDVSTHNHKLIYRPVKYDDLNWICDSHTLGRVCKRGHTDKTPFSKRDYPRFECRACHFDLCDLCAKDQIIEQLEQVEVVNHQHKLTKRSVGYDNQIWICNCALLRCCARGHTLLSFQVKDHPRYECRACDFDLCDLCVKKYIIEQDEDEEGEEVVTHEHKLTFRPVGYDDLNWVCDSVLMGLTCARGHTKGDFQVRDHPRYECRDCNFDLCDLCMLAQQKTEEIEAEKQQEYVKTVFTSPIEKKKDLFMQMVSKFSEEKKEEIKPLKQQKDILFAWVKQEEDKINEQEQHQLEEENAKEQMSLQEINKVPFQSSSLDLTYKQITSSLTTTWIDPDFPHCIGSITKSSTEKEVFSSVVWKKPIDFFPKNQNKIYVFDKVEANDVIQGTYDISFMLSLLSAVAEYPNRLIKVFNQRQFSEQGVFHRKVIDFQLNSNFILVVVDSYFPVDPNQNELIFAKPNGKELWVMILEKSWAKFLGAYKNCENIPAKISLNHILGIPTQSYWLKDFPTHDLKLQLLAYQTQKYIVVVTSKPECKESEGLLAEYSYSILNVYEFENNLFLIKLRNPQGNLEYCGEYGHNSTKWTEPLIEKTGFNRKSDDGVFFLTIEEFEKYFHHLTLGMYKENYSLKSVAANNSSKAVYFKIKVECDSEIAITINQPFLDKVKERQQLSFYPAQICLLDSDGQSIAYGNESERTYGGQTISIFPETFQLLKKGDYTLRTKLLLPPQATIDYSVSLYSETGCLIEKGNKNEFLKLEDKRYLLLGEQKKKEKAKMVNLGGQSHFLNQWLPNNELLIYMENLSRKTIVDAIFTLNEMENIKIKKHNRKDTHQIELRCLPNTKEYAIIKKIDPKEQIKLHWNIQKIYEILQ